MTLSAFASFPRLLSTPAPPVVSNDDAKMVIETEELDLSDVFAFQWLGVCFPTLGAKRATTLLFDFKRDEETATNITKIITANNKRFNKITCIQSYTRILSRMATKVDAITAFDDATAISATGGTALLRLSFTSSDATGHSLSLSTHSQRPRKISKHWT